MRIGIVVLIITLFTSCVTDVDNTAAETMAYVPVYAQPADLENISIGDAQPTTEAGKIYAYGNYIFQNDINKGVHIIDNSQPDHPQKVAFIKIPFSTELAVKGHYLYVNNVSDLVVLDLQNPAAPVVVNRIKDAFPVIQQEYPPFTNVYFVCADPSKGVVVKWELQSVKNPACRR